MGIQGATADFAKSLMRAGRTVAKQAKKLEANGLSNEAKVLANWSENIAGKQGIAKELSKGAVNVDTAQNMVRLASDSFEFKSSIRTAKNPVPALQKQLKELTTNRSYTLGEKEALEKKIASFGDHGSAVPARRPAGDEKVFHRVYSWQEPQGTPIQESIERISFERAEKKANDLNFNLRVQLGHR